jgi:putative RecB family exonuclease
VPGHTVPDMSVQTVEAAGPMQVQSEPGVATPLSASAPTAEGPEPPVLGSLSPSRAADFKACPLLYRFRTIDRLPETPSPEAVRGTVVHAVLERLFDQPAPARTRAAAAELVTTEWEALIAREPTLAAMFTAEGAGEADPVQLSAWLESARELVENYFRLEDPRRVEPAGREQLVEFVIDGLRLRGYVDRIDISPDGDVRIVDYKTGTSPREAFEAKALFQMKFYALVIWRTRGVVPRQLRLMYLSDSDTLSYAPDPVELERFERTLRAIWMAIQRATETRDFRPNPGRLCEWCGHHALCPAQGGTLPAFPESIDAGAPPAADLVGGSGATVVIPAAVSRHVDP